MRTMESQNEELRKRLDRISKDRVCRRRSSVLERLLARAARPSQALTSLVSEIIPFGAPRYLMWLQNNPVGEERTALHAADMLDQ